MEYKVEDLSPVKKKIQITVATPDMNKAIDAALAEYARTTRLPGFRKGKVPPSLIESRYRREVYSEAMTRTVDKSISQIFEELKIKPASKVELDHEDPERNQPFKFTIEFEIFPEFDLPEYKGLAVEEYKAIVAEEEVEATLARIRESLAETLPLEEARVPVNGEVAYVDFAAYENDEPVKSMAAENYQIILGKEEAVPELEELVKTLKPGESGQREISFAKEMANPDIAGKTLLLKVTLQGIAQRKTPELNDELAQRLGAGTVEKMRESILESYRANRKAESREVAQDKLLQQLLDMVDYPLPESLVEHHANVVIDELKRRKSRTQEDGAAEEEVSEEIKTQARKDAESYVKGQIMLLTIAEQENLDISNEEVERRLEDLAKRSGMEAQALKRYYIEQNLIYSLRDRMLTEKALNLVYAAAKVTEVDAPAPDAQPEEKKTAPKKKATEKKPAAEKKTADAPAADEDKPKKAKAPAKPKKADAE